MRQDEVDGPRPGDRHLGHPVGVREGLHDAVGQRPRGGLQLAAQRKGDVGGEVPVFGPGGALQLRRRGDAVGDDPVPTELLDRLCQQAAEPFLDQSRPPPRGGRS